MSYNQKEEAQKIADLFKLNDEFIIVYLAKQLELAYIHGKSEHNQKDLDIIKGIGE